MDESKKIKIINFIQDFNCATIEELQILFDESSKSLKNILNKDLVTRIENVLVHNSKTIDNKMVVAISVLCKYKGRYKKFWRGIDPVYISFFTKNNLLYNIIVADKNNEKGVLKLLKSKSPLIPEADRFILLFEDDACYNEIEFNIPYLYCTYVPELKIINKN